MNHKKLLRLYREGGLAGRRRGERKRATGTRAPTAVAQGPNQRWSLVFVADALSRGRRFRVPAVVDDFTREALTLVVDVRELDAIIARLRRAMFGSDNGTELTSRAVLEWTDWAGVEWHSAAPASRPRTLSWRASTAGSGANA